MLCHSTPAKVLLILLVTLSCNLSAQPGWIWSELPDMPEAVANNAVTAAYCGDTLCVFSFTGIDESKTPQGIHLKSWKYNTISSQWSELPDVPDVQGKIAAGASTVNNLIYLIGGYYVNDNFSELSSDDVHVFDPETNSWLDDGAVIPVPIDDHVQAIWQDSLIFVVTGWSDVQNVNAVQIYDPALDQWQAGNPTPNFGTYRVFGGSGSIIGDSIFYHGGVSNSFNSTKELRRGVINPDDPADITWSDLGDSPGDDGYRSAAAFFGSRLFWIGGAGNGYNFDGIAYDGSGGVPPLTRILTYYSDLGLWDEGLGAPYGVMDLRGIAQLDETSWIICGGMQEDQEVSSRVFLLEYDPSVDMTDRNECLTIFSSGMVQNCDEESTLRVFDSLGRLMHSDMLLPNETKDLRTLGLQGIYLVGAYGHYEKVHFE